jgi:hypothetical protein
MLITTHKNNIPLGYLEKNKLNTISQDRTFDSKTILNINLHASDYSLALVCTRLTFGYWVMFGGGGVNFYPILL